MPILLRYSECCVRLAASQSVCDGSGSFLTGCVLFWLTTDLVVCVVRASDCVEVVIGPFTNTHTFKQRYGVAGY